MASREWEAFEQSLAKFHNERNGNFTDEERFRFIWNDALEFAATSTKTIVWKSGEWRRVLEMHAWEYQGDDDYLVTINGGDRTTAEEMADAGIKTNPQTGALE